MYMIEREREKEREGETLYSAYDQNLALGRRRRWWPTRWKLSPFALAPDLDSQLIFLQIP